MRTPKYSLAVLLLGVVPAVGVAQEKPDGLAVLKKHCSACHRPNGDFFDILDVPALAKQPDPASPYLKAKAPDQSQIFQRMGVTKDMPPRKVGVRPTDAEIAAVKAWIEAGAPAGAAVQPEEAARRDAVSWEATLKWVQDDLVAADARDQPYLRYFTLTHLHNNPSVGDEELRITRAALAKALNSLSWKRKFVVPRAIDKYQTVYAVDIRELEWDVQRVWSVVMSAYPYGLKYKTPNNMQKKYEDNIYKLTGECDIPIVRADWFVATATQTPLYHAILFDGYLPDLKKRVKRSPNDAAAKGLAADALKAYLANPYAMTDYDLEVFLKVPVERNIADGRDVARSAFSKSNISTQNRLVERHESPSGSYWKSYDFKGAGGKASLVANPLGPTRQGHKYPALAFEQDGGEIIFSLPNGLQAYLLVDGKGNRIDVGPIEVVRDKTEMFGRPEVHNGLSCIGCHAKGMQDVPADEARLNSPAKGGALELVQLLYPEKKAMDDLVARDREQFFRAAADVTGGFLQPGVERAKWKPVTDFPEPVVWVAKRYYDYLDLTTVGYELNTNPAELRGLIKFNKQLVRDGLNPLVAVKGGVIDRRVWEAGKHESVMQKVASQLDYTPSRYTKNE